MVYNGYHPELSLQNPSQLGPPGPQNKRNGRNEKMKTWKQALALVLALVMALSLVALPSFAADEDSTGTGTAVTGGSTNTPGLELRKVYDPSTGLLTLEAYATGSTTTTTSTAPVDIVLVLDVSGSMDDPINGYDSQNKIDALKDAVNGFIDKVAEKSPNSSIAVVKFASDKEYDVGNGYNGSGYNYSQIVQSLTAVNEAGANSLKTAVNQLTAAGATRADYGMQHAQTIVNGAMGNGRQKVVIMFTDGQPSIWQIFSATVAKDAIKASKSIKDAGATVYTIGCFGTTPSDKSNIGKYMNRVSSNYPDATNMNNGTRGVGDYYKTVSSASELESIFTEIAHTAGGATLTLGSQTVLKDVVSKYFDLPENAADNITAQSYSCTALDADGAPIWNETPDQGTNYTVSIQDKTISVTGFDYSENWVGKDVNTGIVHPGKKLVVTIPIVDNGTGMGEVPTNGTDSAVYDKDGKQVCAFAQPTAYFPYFTVTHIQSNVDDNGKNYGKNDHSTKHRVPTDGTKFNLTSVVTANHLYGGTFNEDTCINVHNDVQEQGNPMKLNPTENATYYIWEVPDTYLRPFGYWISRHLEGGQGTLSVTQLYLLAAVDRVNYADAGLKVSFGNGTSQYISSSCEELSNPNTEQLGSATVYQMLETVKGHAGGEVIDTWYLKNGIPVNYEGPLTKSEETGKYLDANDKNNSPIDDGCIIGHRLKGKEFESFQKSGVTYRPYWVTLDGVRVEGVRSRNYTFVVGSADPGKPSKDDQLPAVYQYLEKQQSAQTLTLRTNLLAGDTEPAVNDLTVTVIDGSNAPQTIKVAPNGSVRDQVAYQAPAGKVFAGWFTDDSFTTPADLDQVTQDTTIYAKYVSDSYLDLDYSRTGLFRLRGVTLISAVDNPANYQASGFIVGDQKVDVSYASRYRIFKTPANLFGAARDAKLMLADKSLSGTGDLEVTPYWVTLDGTEVHGVTHTLHYNTRTIWE